MGSMARFWAILWMLFFLILPNTVPAGQMNFSWSSESGVFAPLWVTKEAKIFEKYGNQVQLIFIQGATLSAAAVISGEIQVGSFSPQVVITSNMQGLDLVMMSRLGNFLENQIFGKKGITDPKQIKKLAISRLGSSADLASRILLERSGVRPDADVTFLQVGNQSNRLMAIETGNTDAAVLTPPMTLQARKMGFPLLIDGIKLGIPYTSNMLVARKAYVTKNREEARNFMKAIIDGIHYYKTNKNFSLRIISKYMKITDPEVLEENFRAYDFSLKPYPAKEYFALPLQEVAKKDPKVLKENPERFADSSLIKELDESGFIDNLTRDYGLKK